MATGGKYSSYTVYAEQAGGIRTWIWNNDLQSHSYTNLTMPPLVFEVKKQYRTRKQEIRTLKVYYHWVNNSIHFTDNESFLIVYKHKVYKHIYFIVQINQSRATSTTRTIFRLNTNQSHAYEDLP